MLSAHTPACMMPRKIPTKVTTNEYALHMPQRENHEHKCGNVSSMPLNYRWSVCLLKVKMIGHSAYKTHRAFSPFFCDFWLFFSVLWSVWMANSCPAWHTWPTLTRRILRSVHFLVWFEVCTISVHLLCFDVGVGGQDQNFKCASAHLLDWHHLVHNRVQVCICRKAAWPYLSGTQEASLTMERTTVTAEHKYVFSFWDGKSAPSWWQWWWR